MNPSSTRLRLAVAVFALGTAALAQTPGGAELNNGYKALAAKDYDAAIAAFQPSGITQKRPTIIT